MTTYNYLESVKNAIRNYLEDSYSFDIEEYENFEEMREALYDDLWIADSVTGNASGSYTFSTWQAEENLCHNLELLGEALECFGCDANVLEKGADWCDVTIRCYLLGQALDEVLEEESDFLEEHFNKSEEE